MSTGTIADLSGFRINPRSFYVEDYDPLDILLGRKQWSDLTYRPENTEEELEALSGIEDDDPPGTVRGTTQSSNRQNHTASTYRMPYSLKEEEKIVQHLIDKRAYNMVKGNKIWKELEAEGKLSRTWQSMKERYVKHIAPRSGD